MVTINGEPESSAATSGGPAWHHGISILMTRKDIQISIAGCLLFFLLLLNAWMFEKWVPFCHSAKNGPKSDTAKSEKVWDLEEEGPFVGSLPRYDAPSEKPDNHPSADPASYPQRILKSYPQRTLKTLMESAMEILKSTMENGV